MPKDLLDEARARNAELVEEGNAALNAGRVEDALAMADRALENQPDLTTALVLRCEGLTRKQDYAAALEVAEQIVALNPASDLDEIRRNQLRAKLGDLEPAPDRRIPMMAAAAASVLFLSLAGAGLKLYLDNQAAQLALRQESDTSRTVGQPEPAVITEPTEPTPAPVPSTSGTPPAVDPDTPVSNDPAPVMRRESPEPRLPRLSGSVLPQPSANGQVEVRPVSPDIEGDIGGSVAAARPTPAPEIPPRVATADPDPMVQPSGGSPSADPDPGEIEISVSSGTPRPVNMGNSETTTPPTGTGATALLRAATQQYQLGNYTQAAVTYERALAAGADPVTANQRLGMAYGQIGRRSEAAAALNRAIAAAESSVRAGGNRERLEAVIATCRQQLRVLQGG